MGRWQTNAVTLSYSPLDPLQGVMRRPDRTELEFAMLLFMVLAPMAYFTVRGFMALLAALI